MGVQKPSDDQIHENSSDSIAKVDQWSPPTWFGDEMPQVLNLIEISQSFSASFADDARVIGADYQSSRAD